MSEKIYCGNGKIISTQHGPLTKISMSKDDINKMVTYMRDNNLDWINLNFKEKKNKVEGKASHYLEVDQWKPDQNSTPAPQTEQAPPLTAEDDLPF